MRILTGWKEISSHLRYGVRTVQRWELIGLPIHRLKSVTRGGAVVAFAEELDAWMESMPVRVDTIRDLHARIASLETEARALKNQLAFNRNLGMRERAQEMK
jgi:hypothetical protein